MNTEIFDSSFFGYTNLPDSIELGNRKLVPIKVLKLKYEGNSMSGGVFAVCEIRHLCEYLNIQLYRPVKGLYCIEDSYVRFFDYLHQLILDGLISGYLCNNYDKIIDIFRGFATENQ